MSDTNYYRRMYCTCVCVCVCVCVRVHVCSVCVDVKREGGREGGKEGRSWNGRVEPSQMIHLIVSASIMISQIIVECHFYCTE